MLQSMRSRENDGAPGVTDKCELYMMLDHHWTSGPEARDHAACSSCAASPHGGTLRPRPPEVSAEERVDHKQRQAIHRSSQFSSIQSNSACLALPLHAWLSALLADPAIHLLLTRDRRQCALPLQNLPY